MKIAIIGAIDSVEKVYKILSKENKDIEFIKYSEDEIKNLIPKLKNQKLNIDGIFFTGIGVYSKVSSEIKFQQPTIYTERGIMGIVKAFWKLTIEEENIEDKRIALDIIDEKDLIEVLNEFNIKIKSYNIQKYLPSKSEREYLNYYIKKYNKGEIDCVFTSFGYIYNYLKKKDIPVYRIQATNIDIKNRFNKLINDIRLESINERVVQVQIIQIKEEDNKNTKKIIEEISLEEEILKYSREIEAMMQTISEYEYMIISNRGAALSIENIESLYNIIENSKSNNLILGVGIGEGDTFYQSESNARNALSKSIYESKGDIYTYDGKDVRGPLMKREELKYKNLTDDEGLELSKKIGISYQYIEKINSVIRKLGRNEFTSKELSEALYISERSANRILKKIIDNGYGEEVGLVSPISAGRPRRKIKIKFN